MNITVLADNHHYMSCEKVDEDDIEKGWPTSEIHDCSDCSVIDNCCKGEQIFVEIEEDYIYTSALKKWGIEAQKGMVIEEIGEFLQAWNKTTRKSADPEKTKEEFLEELVDLHIMINQMVVHYSDDGAHVAKKDKLERLARKLGLCADRRP